MLLRMRSGQQWISFAVTAGARAASPPPAGDGDLNPELADVARLLRRLVRQAVSAARAEEDSVRHLLTSYLGPQVAASPVANGFWPRYDQVNVQAGLDAWLAGPGAARSARPDDNWWCRPVRPAIRCSRPGPASQASSPAWTFTWS